MLGFMPGKQDVEDAFGRRFSDRFDIHRTRKGFANNGIDTFASMAEKDVAIVDRVVQEEMSGSVDFENGAWSIPSVKAHQD